MYQECKFAANDPYPQVEANFIPNLQDFYDNPEKYALAPFQIFGNLYYVGDKKVCMHLIDTGDGLILFDSGYGNTTHMILDSIKALGFDPMDIRIIIHSHGHFDHFGSGNALRSLTGAKVYMSAVDTQLIRQRPDRALVQWGPCPNDPICWPDVEIGDGDHIRLGNTDITCILSPGHTLGTMSFFFDVSDGVRTLRAGYMGGTGFLTVYKDYCRKFGLPEDKCQRMKATIQKLMPQKVDIVLGNHPGQNCTLEKRAWMLEHPEKNPFINPEAWHIFLNTLETRRANFEALGY